MTKFTKRVIRKVRRVVRGGGKSHPAIQNPAIQNHPAVQAISEPEVDARARLLLDSGLFDEDFYRAQSLVRKPGAVAAAEHFLARGMPLMRAFHPLILPVYLPMDVRRAWRESDIEGILAWLSSSESLSVSWSPTFSPRNLLRTFAQSASAEQPDEWEDEADLEPGDGHPLVTAQEVTDEDAIRVVDWLRNIGEGDLLPIDDRLGARDPLRFGDLRNRLIASAKEIGAQRARLGHRTHDKWSKGRDRRWLQGVAHVEIPHTDGPLLSVVMPVWNREFIVEDAIRSVQAQSFDNWELIVVDDGSTDGTRDVVRRIGESDHRVRLVQGMHGGVSAARNSAVDVARGRYLAFLDSDNKWQPNFLEFALKGMISSGARAGYAGVELIDADTREKVYRAYEGGLDELKVYNFIDLNVLVVETELVREVGIFDTKIKRWVDHDFVLRIAERTEPKFFHFVGCVYENSDDFVRITTAESNHWQYVVLEKAWVDWARLRAEVSARIPGRVSVVIPSFRDVGMTIGAVRALIEFTSDRDLEIIVVENGSPAPQALTLDAALAGAENVQITHLPRNLNFALGSNVGVAASTGEFVLFLNNDTAVRSGWLDPLLRRLEDPAVAGVQPLLLYEDDTIQSAGTIFPLQGELPTHFLVGHSPDDAQELGDFRFSAVTAAALLMRASDVVELEGFDTFYVNGWEDVDLCLRAREGGKRYFVVEPRSRVNHLESKTPGRGAQVLENRAIFIDRWKGLLPGPDDFYTPLGFEVAHVGADRAVMPAPKLLVTRPRHGDVHLNGEAVPVLRWSIKNPATAGKIGDNWGDTHFISNLADGLRSFGQEVVTYRRTAFAVPATAYDDVNLAIRGLIKAYPQPAKTNVLWVISHPELVEDDELHGFDLVFAASEKWAAETTARTGVAVRPLLQATDPSVFSLPPVQPQRDDGVIFVGQARPGAPRKIVMDAIAAGVDVRVWGPRWERFIDQRYIVGENYPNAELGQLYSSASVVLNDHWEDMAEEGFISNRLFDAVASGARVVSDYVEGVDALFGGVVRTYNSLEELSELCAPAGEALFPDDRRLAEAAREVAVKHTFHARAEQLLHAVREFRQNS